MFLLAFAFSLLNVGFAVASSVVLSFQVFFNQVDCVENIRFIYRVHTFIMCEIVSKNNRNICVWLNTKPSRITDINWVMGRIQACVENQNQFLDSACNAKKHEISKDTPFINSMLHHLIPSFLPRFI